MILVDIKPRQDNRFDIYVSGEGEHFLNSSQGYENVEDAEAIVHRLWPPLQVLDELPELIAPVFLAVRDIVTAHAEAVVLRIEYRDGKTKTEQLR